MTRLVWSAPVVTPRLTAYDVYGRGFGTNGRIGGVSAWNLADAYREAERMFRSHYHPALHLGVAVNQHL